MTQASSPRQRRSRGQAWYWRQTDSWYFTKPGTKKRVRLLDDHHRPIRGRENQTVADLALARVKANDEWRPEAELSDGTENLVATVASRYIEHCRARSVVGEITKEYFDEASRYLNSFCEYCGRLPVSEVKKAHVQHWVEKNSTWRSPVTKRNAMTVVLSAFNYSSETHGISNPLKGTDKPPQRPRLLSFDADDEQSIYEATDEPFRNFLFAAIHTGLRPFCELARLSVNDIEETPRGMMWRVNSTKTGKTRKIPVRREVATLTRRLIVEMPAASGDEVFRNSQGRPWKKVTGVARFTRIKRKLGWNGDSKRSRYSTYTARHTFAHRMLAGYWTTGQGCSVEVLAELMGDIPTVAYAHYGREWGQHYQEPLWQAIGVS